VQCNENGTTDSAAILAFLWNARGGAYTVDERERRRKTACSEGTSSYILVHCQQKHHPASSAPLLHEVLIFINVYPYKIILFNFTQFHTFATLGDLRTEFHLRICVEHQTCNYYSINIYVGETCLNFMYCICIFCCALRFQACLCKKKPQYFELA
jgi:hypothetical protein